MFRSAWQRGGIIIAEVRISEKFSIAENGKLSKKKFLDALALLKADVEFLEREVERVNFE